MRIALLEDDIDQATLLRQWLESAEHTVNHFEDAAEFLRATHYESFDLFILDWLLPESSGLTVLKEVRERHATHPPVLFVTVRDDERYIVRALEAGADDYMIKPVRRSETLARINALLRRSVGTVEAPIDAPPYQFDLEHHQVRLHDEIVSLTPREFELAAFLFRRAGQIVSRNHLLESVWGTGHAALNTRTVDTHISRLRKKLHIVPENGWTLASIYQHGYRLEATEALPSSDDQLQAQV